MKRNRVLGLVTLAVALAFGMTLTGCASTAVKTVSWSNYTSIPNKDYAVVGVVVVRTDNIKTLNADLMEAAKEIGAHDVINVRIDVESESSGGAPKIFAASGVAIKYTDTLKNESGTAQMSSTSEGGGSSSCGKKWYNPFTWFKK
jgi:hypothetical protein